MKDLKKNPQKIALKWHLEYAHFSWEAPSPRSLGQCNDVLYSVDLTDLQGVILSGADPGFFKRGGVHLRCALHLRGVCPGGGPTLGPMLKSLHRGPKRGGSGSPAQVDLDGSESETPKNRDGLLVATWLRVRLSPRYFQTDLCRFNPGDDHPVSVTRLSAPQQGPQVWWWWFEFHSGIYYIMFTPCLLVIRLQQNKFFLATRMGAYNLTSVRTAVRPSVRPSVDSDFSEVYGSTGLKL